jgi:hypothetical protein
MKPGMTPEQVREFLAPLEKMLDQGGLNSEGAETLVKLAKEFLPADEFRRWMRGRRARLNMALHGRDGHFAGRSTAYYLNRTYRAGKVLHDAGLVDMDRGFRDRETGRKVKTLVGELARLNFVDDDALINSYRNLRDAPLDEVKAVVRQNNPRRAALRTGQSLDSSVGRA